MRWPRDFGGSLCYGGDYNPEQWPESCWTEDVALMRAAGVNLVSLGVFAWSSLEPAEGRYTFDWLDRVFDVLHDGGVSVALATPTASPPPWFGRAYPDALTVNHDGVRLTHGSRDTYCMSAPAYRSAATRIARALAERYAGHPALAMWHVHNEYGTPCHCDHAAAAFRTWLRARYGSLDRLAEAWTSAFWSQGHADWDEITPPRATQYLHNPTQELDFRRFVSDELLACFRDQRDVLRELTPDVPVTTNFVFDGWVPVDHASWASELDLVAIDCYPSETGVAGQQQAAFMADLARSWAGGRPWLLMEQSPNIVGTHGRLRSKPPGEMARISLTHLARGSQGAMFFQWRGSRGGAEMYHSAMVPHAGPDTRVFREVTELGALIGRLSDADSAADVAPRADADAALRADDGAARGADADAAPRADDDGARAADEGRVVDADVAILWDAPSWWALQSRSMPAPVDYLGGVRAVHRALWRAGTTTDFALPGDDLSGYRLVVVPHLYAVDGRTAANLARYVADGGTLVVTYLSGTVDEDLRVHLGGYAGAFAEVLGIRVEEFHPLAEDGVVRLTTGDTGSSWSEDLRTTTAEVVAGYAEGPLDGRPAITRNAYGDGTAWYVSTALDDPGLDRLLTEVRAGAGIPTAEPTDGVEVVHRRMSGTEMLFAINHTGVDRDVPADGVDLVTGADVTGSVRLGPGGYAVVRLADARPAA
jgi:beta-galactosidase